MGVAAEFKVLELEGKEIFERIVKTRLHIRAEREKTTISELVGQAVRERYLGNFDHNVIFMKCTAL